MVFRPKQFFFQKSSKRKPRQKRRPFIGERYLSPTNVLPSFRGKTSVFSPHFMLILRKHRKITAKRDLFRFLNDQTYLFTESARVWRKDQNK